MRNTCAVQSSSARSLPCRTTWAAGPGFPRYQVREARKPQHPAPRDSRGGVPAGEFQPHCLYQPETAHIPRRLQESWSPVRTEAVYSGSSPIALGFLFRHHFGRRGATICLTFRPASRRTTAHRTHRLRMHPYTGRRHRGRGSPPTESASESCSLIDQDRSPDRSGTGCFLRSHRSRVRQGPD
jgi:hypothetical protein